MGETKKSPGRRIAKEEGRCEGGEKGGDPGGLMTLTWSGLGVAHPAHPPGKERPKCQ